MSKHEEELNQHTVYTKRLVFRDTIINIIYPLIVAVILLAQGYLIGVNIGAKKVAAQDRVFLEQLSIMASRNRDLINEARIKVGLPPDPIQDELKELVNAVYNHSETK